MDQLQLTYISQLRSSSSQESTPLFKSFVIFGLVIFLSTIALCISNMIRFRNQITESLANFYIITIISFLLRSFAFTFALFQWAPKLKALFFILSGASNLSISLTQVNIYIQLILRMKAINSSMLEINSQGDIILKRKERIFQWIIYGCYLIYPALFIYEFYLGPMSNFQKASEYLLFYYKQIWMGMVVMALLLFSSSMYLLIQIKKNLKSINQNQIDPNFKKIRYVVIFFLIGFLIRISLCTILAYNMKISEESIVFCNEKPFFYILFSVICCFITDLIPVFYLLRLHCINFSIKNRDSVPIMNFDDFKSDISQSFVDLNPQPLYTSGQQDSELRDQIHSLIEQQNRVSAFGLFIQQSNLSSYQNSRVMESSFGNGMMTREMFLTLPVFRHVEKRNTVSEIRTLNENDFSINGQRQRFSTLQQKKDQEL